MIAASVALALLVPVLGGQSPAASRSATGSMAQAQDLCWAPDGRQLFFSAMRVASDYSDYTPDKWGVYRYDSRTGQISLVVASALFVSVSPNGDRLAVGKLVSGNRDLYVVGLDGSEIARLTEDPAEDLAASWAPDGQRLAFTSKRDGHPEVYVVDQDGNNLRRLTSSGAAGAYNPSWSPDGRHIAYYLEKGDGRDQVYVVRPDASGAVNVTNGAMNNVFPGWTPDGRVIYGQTATDGRALVMTVRADGTGRKPLLGLQSPYARYSPDGSQIAFIRGDGDGIEIVTSDGRSVKKVPLAGIR